MEGPVLEFKSQITYEVRRKWLNSSIQGEALEIPWKETQWCSPQDVNCNAAWAHQVPTVRAMYRVREAAVLLLQVKI